MTSITNSTVLSANVRVNNSYDENKKYEISAVVSINKEPDGVHDIIGHGKIIGGTVSLNANTVATFTKYSNLSIAYNIEDEEAQTEILNAVQAFCTNVKDYADNANLSATTEEANANQ